jgi:hypothetical protein
VSSGVRGVPVHPAAPQVQRPAPPSPPPLGDWLKDPEVEVTKAGPERRVVILRRIDLWSALKVSLALYLCVFVVFLAGATVLWLGARSAGLLDNVEHWVEVLGFADDRTFHLKGPEILKMAAVIGPILVVLGSLATVASVAVFNVAARVFGGVEMTISEGDGQPPR